MTRKVTQEEVIERFKMVNGDRYDYSKVVYGTMAEKVIIGCRIHGMWLQSPLKHLTGRQCPKCADISRLKKKRSNSEDFIKKATKIHGDFYNYDKVKYVNNYTKVIICCPIHGEWLQAPMKHLDGNGCPTCGKTKNKGKDQVGQRKFIKEAKEKFGDLYDYSEVRFRSIKGGVKILCATHRLYTQTPKTHLSDRGGCPTCAREIYY